MSERAVEHVTAEDCCSADPRIARHFDRAMERAAAAGELPAMVPISRGLLALLEDAREKQPTVLELGAGSGALTVALLKAGAVSANGVDLSAESVATARRRAAEAGVGDRAHFAVGDGASVALQPSDWVVLDRVICCYAHVDRLLGNAIGAARRRLVFSVPEVRGWRGTVNRLVVGAENATNRFRGRPCPGYLHPITLIESRLAAAGLHRLRETTVGLWYGAVWERPARG